MDEDDDEDINKTAKDLDLDVAGVDPNKEGAAAAQTAGADSYDEGAPSDDEKPDDIIADIGSMGSIEGPAVDNADEGNDEE